MGLAERLVYIGSQKTCLVHRVLEGRGVVHRSGEVCELMKGRCFECGAIDRGRTPHSRDHCTCSLKLNNICKCCGLGNAIGRHVLHPTGFGSANCPLNNLIPAIMGLWYEKKIPEAGRFTTPLEAKQYLFFRRDAYGLSPGHRILAKIYTN